MCRPYCSTKTLQAAWSVGSCRSRANKVTRVVGIRASAIDIPLGGTTSSAYYPCDDSVGTTFYLSMLRLPHQCATTALFFFAGECGRGGVPVKSQRDGCTGNGK